MPRSKNRMPQGRYPHRSLSRSRKSDRSNDTNRSCTSAHASRKTSLLSPTDETQRRASSASSPRTFIRTDDIIISVQQPTTTIDLSYPTLEKQTTFNIPIVQITRECIVCMTEKPLDEYESVYGDACVHAERTICNSCVYENTKCLVENSMTYYEDIRCPETNCHGILDYQGIRQILLVIGKNKTLFEQYDQHLINLQLEKMPEFIWCTYGCGSGQLYDVALTSANPAVTCVKCNRMTCFKHRVIWHTDMSCDQYDLLNNLPSKSDATNKWLELFAKQCPQCQWHIQKNEGCDHMTCRYCKHQFCWECLENYHHIANHGAHYHRKSCSHYQPNPATSSAST